MERRVGIFAGVSRRETCRRVCVNLQICFVWLDHKKILEKMNRNKPNQGLNISSFCLCFVFVIDFILLGTSLRQCTGFPKKDACFLKIKNIPDLLSDDKKGKLMGNFDF